MTVCIENITSVLLQPVHLESDSPSEDELLFFDHPCPRYDQHVTKNEVNKFSLCLFVLLFVCVLFIVYLFIVCLFICLFVYCLSTMLHLQSLSDMIDSYMNSSDVQAVVERVQALIDPGTTVTTRDVQGGCLA